MNSITDTDLKTLWHIQIKYCNYTKINIIKNLFCLIWIMNVMRKLSTSVILYVGESSRDRFWGLILRKNWLWDLVCWKEIYSEIYSFNILVGIKTTFHRFLHRVKTILIYYSKNMIETVAHTTIDDQPPSYEDAVNNNSR